MLSALYNFRRASLTDNFLIRFDDDGHIIEEPNVWRSEHMEIAVDIIHRIVEAQTKVWRQCALEYSRLLIRAKLDFGDILQWNLLKSNDLVQMGIVFGDQIEFRRQYQNGVDFRFIWITCAANGKCLI